MARVNARDFVGTRCRLQRLRDAKVFNGWIEDFHGTSAKLSLCKSAALSAGDEFRVEGFGHYMSVVFNAVLDASEANSLSGLRCMIAETDGANARLIETRRHSVKLSVRGDVRFSTSPESVRIATCDLPVSVTWDWHLIEGVVVDVGLTGVGVVAKDPIESRLAVKAQITIPSGQIVALASTRYCRPDTERAGFYRFGLMFTEVGRIDRPRWERYIRELG